MIKKNHQGTLQ